MNMSAVQENASISILRNHKGRRPSERFLFIAIALLLLVRVTFASTQLDGHRVTLTGRNLETFKAVWNQADDQMKEEFLCFFVQLGVSGGVSRAEVERVDYGDQLCGLKWLWIFGGLDSNDQQKLDRISDPEYAHPSSTSVFADLGPYGYESRALPGQATDLAGIKTYILQEERHWDLEYSPEFWSLRRLCKGNDNPICTELKNLARQALEPDPNGNQPMSRTPHGEPKYMQPDEALLILWATATAPEPEIILDYLKKYPPDDPRIGLNASEVLESWNSPQAEEIALKYGNWAALFRMGVSIADRPSLDHMDPAQCMVSQTQIPAEVVIVRKIPADWYWPNVFCASDPAIVERYFYRLRNTMSKPAFYLSADRPLLQFLIALSFKARTEHADPRDFKYPEDLIWEGDVPNDLIEIIADIAVAGKNNWTLADVPMLNKAFREVEHRGMEHEALAVSSVIPNIAAYTRIRNAVLTLAGYLSLWIICLLLYPHFNLVRANVIWNAKIRKLFFLFNPLLTMLPPLRRMLLQPFKEDLRKDVRRTETEAVFFTDLQVVEDENTIALVSALPSFCGRVVIQGKSGLGKTTYLHRLARESQEPVVYLEARACDSGVLAAIQSLLPGWLKDEEFLGSLVFHGGLAVIIDGLNEAGPSARIAIMSFLAQSVGGKVVIGTQPMRLFWAKSVRVLELQPLDLYRAKRFLELQGVPEDRAQALIDSALSAQNESDREASRFVLSNPFDLSVIAAMIKQDVTPNLLTLPEQQYRTMADRFKEQENYEFPLNRFSELVYQLVQADQHVIPATEFASELVIMAKERMVIERNNSYTFRHDKVRDFFLVVALDEANRISQHYGDPRFLSAYLSLAIKLTNDQARELREDVEEWALDHDDRSLADELRRALRRRRSVERKELRT